MNSRWFFLASISAVAVYAQRSVPGNAFGIPGRNATYDYVIVGGGTAGLTLAHRLAEDGMSTVAVVEAGGFYGVENGNTSVVPAYNQDYNYITPDSQWDAPLVDWGFLTTPQTGANGQIFHYGRGKMLGGCSAENAMNYNRPTRGSLQAWADAVNDSSYTWDSMLRYFEKSITYSNPDQSIRAPNATVPYLSPNNQSTGPLQVSFPNWATPFASWAQHAFRELGIADVHSLIEGSLLGSQYSPLTLNPDDQTRSSSQRSYLAQSLQAHTSNLKIYTHTFAHRVIFSSEKTATGVVVHAGPSAAPPFTLTASREVILSAGAFQSPQLLMLSGVGPAAEIAAHSIPLVADLLGVGQNMWDHVVLSVGRRVDVSTYGGLMNASAAREAERAYAEDKTGILTNDQSDYLGWEKLPANISTASFPADWPDIEYEISSAPFGTPPVSTPESPIDEAFIQPVLLTPLSRGNISLASANPTDAPLINPNWLTHPSDQRAAVTAFRRARALFATSAIAPILIGAELLPGVEAVPEDADDAQILAYVQANLGFNWHASCTCKMGRAEDPMAVVDARAQVYGVRGLRVVDASAFALLTPGHPQAMVYALAEKIAVDILASR